MRIRIKIPIAGWAVCSVLLLSGCGKRGQETVKTDLKKIQLMFHNYEDKNGKPPTSIEDVESNCPETLADDPAFIQRLKDARYHIYWGTTVRRILSEQEKGGNRILAYEKDVPSKGGWVVLVALRGGDTGNGVKRMTAEEFQAAPKGDDK